MLTQLYIKNFAIIDQAEIIFYPQMTVITGETGAGKSIILDALELVLGARSESSFLRQDKDCCEIIASFNIENNPIAQDFLVKNNLGDPSECILRRIITKDKKSKAFINQCPVPLQTLRDCSNFLIAIHGQHEHQLLISRDNQREILDNFGQHNNLTQDLKNIYTQYQELNNLYTQSQQNLSHRDNKLDFLKYQVEELDNLNLIAPTELENLEQEHKKLADIHKYLTNYQNIQDLLDNHLLINMTKIKTLLNTLPESNLNNLITTADIQLSEASHELQNLLNNIDLNPERLAQIETRLSHIYDIARKHRIKPHEIPELHQKLQQELELLLKLDSQLEILEKKLVTIKTHYLNIAHQLSEARQKSAINMAQAVTNYMAPLGMSGGKFEIKLIPVNPEENNITAYGLEKTEFLVSANPGMPLQSLSKVASGGELSRISLAIQLIATETSRLPILIFDEVDVGIGGATAAIVGQLLKQLAQNTQVICITHLPQVAACGTHHISVQKNISKTNTETQIKLLNPEERILEIARMLGGLKITKQTLAHARELVGA